DHATPAEDRRRRIACKTAALLGRPFAFNDRQSPLPETGAAMSINPTDAEIKRIDGEQLCREKRSPRRFKKLVEVLRANGASDRAIAQAMAAARTVIEPIGGLR